MTSSSLFSFLTSESLGRSMSRISQAISILGLEKVMCRISDKSLKSCYMLLTARELHSRGGFPCVSLLIWPRVTLRLKQLRCIITWHWDNGWET